MELKTLFPEGLDCGVAGKTMSIKVLKLHNTPVTENWVWLLVCSSRNIYYHGKHVFPKVTFPELARPVVSDIALKDHGWGCRVPLWAASRWHRCRSCWSAGRWKGSAEGPVQAAQDEVQQGPVLALALGPQWFSACRALLQNQGRRLSVDCWCQLLLAVFQLSLGSPTDLQNLRADPAVKGQPCCCLGGRLLTKVRTLPHLPGFSPEHRDAQHLTAATCIDNADETRLHCWNSKGSPIPPPASHLIFLRTLTSFLSIFLLHQSSSSSQGCRDPPALLYWPFHRHQEV